MKIAYICADGGIPVFGHKGCSLHVQEITRAFSEIGHDVTLLARRIDGPAPDDLNAVELIQLPAIPKSTTRAREQKAIASNFDIAHAIKSYGPFDIVYERYALWSHAGLAAAKAAGAATVLEVNAPLIEEQRKFRELDDIDGATNASMRVFAAADVIVAVSEGVARYLADFPQTRNKVHVIPNGVNAKRFDIEHRTRTDSERPFTLGFVGTLKPWHGVDLLIRAFALFEPAIPNSRLLIIGDGPEQKRLVELSDNLKIADKVVFTGSVAPDQVPDLLADVDVGVAPYPDLRDFYFSPLKAYEYMASGLPVVASRIGQLNTLIDHEQNGLLCEPGNIHALAEACSRLHNDPELASQLAFAGRQKVLSEHTWPSVAERIFHLAKGAMHDSSKQRRYS